MTAPLYGTVYLDQTIYIPALNAYASVNSLSDPRIVKATDVQTGNIIHLFHDQYEVGENIPDPCHILPGDTVLFKGGLHQVKRVEGYRVILFPTVNEEVHYGLCRAIFRPKTPPKLPLTIRRVQELVYENNAFTWKTIQITEE